MRRLAPLRSCVVVTCCCGCCASLFRFKLPPLQGVPLSRMFAVFEEHKERLQVIEHSLGQCSLESVFNQFASQQDEERGVVHGMAR
jgi:hypothetical protein